MKCVKWFGLAVVVLGLGVASDPARIDQIVAVAQSGPVIASISGFTESDAGISNGVVSMVCGSRQNSWNGWRVINDQRGLYTWTINGSGFGTKQGSVTIGGINIPINSWGNEKIVIDPTLPYTSSHATLTLEVRLPNGARTSRQENVVPAIRSRIYQQCTWHVAKRRIEMGLQPSPRAYANYTQITASWVPQRGDQLKWGGTAAKGGTHQAIIESVSGPTTTGNVTTYTIVISQYNAGCNNEPSNYTTTFQITRQSNGQNVVTAFPKFRSGGTNATGFYR